MKPKNCLIFGASGQIGRHLIRKLTKNNYMVTAVTRNLHQKAYLFKTHIFIQKHSFTKKTIPVWAVPLEIPGIPWKSMESMDI